MCAFARVPCGRVRSGPRYANDIPGFWSIPSPKTLPHSLTLKVQDQGGMCELSRCSPTKGSPRSRPLLFRASNAQVTRAFKAAPHPHGNTISDDGFKRGLVRSGTDYSVYEQFGMKGLDLAFYQPRSQYHTKWDTVSNLNGAASLWAMMESALATARVLASDESTRRSDEPVLYFDGKWSIV